MTGLILFTITTLIYGITGLCVTIFLDDTDSQHPKEDIKSENIKLNKNL